MAESKKTENGIGDNIIDEALKAYGIDKKNVFSSRMDAETGEAVIVTAGGKKVRFKAGDAAARLDEIAITGINPKAKDRKVIAGAPKK